MNHLAVDDPADLDASVMEEQRQGVTIILHLVISDRQLPRGHVTLNGNAENRTISILSLVKIAANSTGVARIETNSMATTGLGNKRPVS